MIKFFKDNYNALSGLSGAADNICFAVDRQVIICGGKEYGKDQVKVVTTSAAIAAAPGEVGTLYFATADQAVYKKTATSAEVVLSSVTGEIAALKEELSAVISTAYADGKIVLGSGTGITSSRFVPDTTSGELTGITTELSSTLVNAATLSAAVADINQAAATVAGGSGIAVTTGAATANGTEYTVDVDLANADTNTLSIDANGKLTDNITLSAITTNTGYAASYALVNTRTNTKLGSDINIVKDQFLSAAAYVYGTEEGGVVTEVPAGSATAATNRYLKLVFDVNTDGDATDSEAQNIVYINVNELFDSYTSGNGITVDNSTNTIAVKVDPDTETDGTNAYLTVGANGLAVNGINDAISANIQALGQTTAEAGKFVTQVGVDATNDTLTATIATVSASQVAFDSSEIDALTATTVQGAIEDVLETVAGRFESLSAAEVGDTTTYIQSISETAGIITATSATLDAEKVAYTNALAAANVDDVSGALDDIYSDINDISGVISSLDYGPSGVVGDPANGTAYTIINQVSQTDGLISATTVDMTSENTYQSGVVAAINAGTTSGAARVAITAGTQASANEQFSNYIADYCSFHDANGNLL